MPTTNSAQQNVTRIIQEEHASLAAVLHGMQELARSLHHKFNQEMNSLARKKFRAMLLYMNDYPERIHHPKEDRYLFARLRLRTAQLDATLAELEYQHALGAGLIHGLEKALIKLEEKGAAAFPGFHKLVDEYGRFYAEHMRLEEKIVFPAASRVLNNADWQAIDAGFSAYDDPRHGSMTKDSFDKLFVLIADMAPEQIGAANLVDS